MRGVCEGGNRTAGRCPSFIFIIIFISVTIFVVLLFVCRLFCCNRAAPPLSREPPGPAPPPLHPMPALPSLPGGGGMFGLEPPPYSEVAAQPSLFPQRDRSVPASPPPGSPTHFYGGLQPPPGTADLCGALRSPPAPAAALSSASLPSCPPRSV
ncbi:basic proline-rich protein-like [Tympanuchus pallidicinctus]|uniref:basic proline-rich protein-like n=1 Tax=Tympanuchus pallidicinctus TaxID=109042 RepID=UPI0022875F32|nr:basic proline-rich protein-like [Tympanuchus pallidicinctus]